MKDHTALRPALFLSTVLLLVTGAPAMALDQHAGPPETPPEPATAKAGAPAGPPSEAPPVPAPVAVQEAPPTPAPPRQSYLGVVLEDVTDETVQRLELPEQRGALVREVVDGTAADSAGFRAGDVVLEWRGEPVYSAAELGRLVRETPPGRRVRVTVFRDGSRTTLSVTLHERRGPGASFRGPGPSFHGELPPEARARIRERMERARKKWEHARGHMEHLGERLEELEWDPDEAGDSISVHGLRLAPRLRGEGAFYRMSGRARLGVRLQSLTPQLAEYFGLGERSGALVASVRDGSPADSAGLQAGDILLSVGGENVSEVGDAVRAVRESAGSVEVRVLRRGEERTVTARLPAREHREDGEDDPGAG